MKRFFSRFRTPRIDIDDSTIFDAISIGDLEKFEDLIEAGVNINDKRKGEYPLMFLVAHKHPALSNDVATKMAQILINKGADLNEVHLHANNRSLLEYTVGYELHSEVSKAIIIAQPSKADEALKLGLQFRVADIVKLSIEQGAQIENNSQEADSFLLQIIDKCDIEMIKVFAAGKFDFNRNIQDLPVLMNAIRHFYGEKTSEETKKIKKFITEAAEIMFESGANIDAEEGGIREIADDGQILSKHKTLAEYALRQDYSIKVAKMIVAKGGRELVTQVMCDALDQSDISLLKRSITAGANVVGSDDFESPLTYISRNDNIFFNIKREFSDILMRAGSDISFENQAGQRVLSEVNNAEVLNSIVFFTTLTRSLNQSNWEYLQEHLQSSEDWRNQITPLNKYLLNTYLPDGELKSTIATEEIQLDREELIKLDQGSQNLFNFFSSENVNKLVEIKQKLLTRFTNIGETNPESIANSFVIDLAINSEKLKEIPNLFTVVAGVQPTMGKRSILQRAFQNKVDKDLPDLVAANIQSFAINNDNMSEKVNFHANAVLKKFLNPSPKLESVTSNSLVSNEHERT